MRSRFLQISALVLLSVLIFGQASQFEFVQYDDPAYVSENGIVTQGLNPKGITWAFTMQGETHLLMHDGVANLWHPLTWISHMADCQLYGVESAVGHHLTSIILHTLGGVLALLIGHALGLRGWVAFIGAALYMIHPLKAESVAWVSERKDVLSGFFFLLSLYLVLLKDCKWRALALASFVLALLSKPSVVILPPCIVLLMLWRDGRDLTCPRTWYQESLKWLPWFALSIIVAAITVCMQAGGSHQAFMGSYPLTYRLLSMPLFLFTYLQHLIYPVDLNFHYPHPRPGLWIYIGAWAVLGGLAFAVYLLRERFPALLVSVLWFLLCWLPVSGLLYVGTSFTCDRYVYLATLLPALYLAKWAFSRQWMSVVGVLLVGVLSWLCYQQVGIWRDSRSLFTHATEAQPGDGLGWTNLGALNSRESELESAILCYQNALDLNATEYMALHNLGDLYRKQGKVDNALEQFTLANECAPSYMPSWRARGYVLREQERFDEAISVFQQAFQAGGSTSATELWLAVETMLANQQIDEARAGMIQLKTLQRTPFINEQIARAEQFLQQVQKKR